MFAKAYLVLLCSLSTIVAGGNARAVDHKRQRPVIGVLDGGLLYTVTTAEIESGAADDGSAVTTVSIHSVPGTFESAGQRSARVYARNRTAGTRVPYRWRIRDGYFWGTSSGVSLHYLELNRVLIEDLPLFAGGDKGQKEFKRKYPGREEDEVFVWDWLYPVKRTSYSYLWQDFVARGADPLGIDHPLRGQTAPVKGIYFEFMPVAKEKVVLFILQKRTISLWEGSAPRAQERESRAAPRIAEIGLDNLQQALAGMDAAHRNDRVQWSEVKAGRIKVDFDEPFHVFGDESAYFLLTTSGRLYLARKPAKGDTRALALWKDAERPIRAVITDTAAGKSFAFAAGTGKEQEREGVYFLLEERIKPNAFSRKPVTGMKADPAVKLVVEYARVLEREGSLERK